MHPFRYAALASIALAAPGCDNVKGEPYDFTVYVDDDGDLATPAAPLSDALVTVDAGGELITATTDAEGQVRIDGLTQPFWVTAQHDITFDEGTGRIAASLHIEGSDQRAFGLMMFAGDGGFEPEVDQPADPATRVTGTIANIPPIPAGYSLDVVGKIEGEPLAHTTALTGPTSNTTASASYTLSNLPTGPIVLYGGIRQDTGDADHWGYDYEHAVVLDERVQTAHQQTTTAPDLDFATHGIPFGDKSIDLTGWETGGYGPVFDVIVDFGDGDGVPIGIHGTEDASSWAPPTSLSLAEGSFDGVRVANAVGVWTVEGVDWWQYGYLPADESGSLSYDLVPGLSIDQPAHEGTAAADQPLEVAWSGGDPAAAMTGVFLEGEPEDLDVDFVSWQVLLPGDATSVALPRADRPMLAPGAYGVEVFSNRSASYDAGPGTVDDFGASDAPERLRELFPWDMSFDAGQFSPFELQ